MDGFIPGWALALVVVAVLGALVALIVGEVASARREKGQRDEEEPPPS